MRNVLYLGVLYPCFKHQLDGGLIGCVEHKPDAGERLGHGLNKRFYLILKKIIEYTGCEEYRAPEASILSNHAVSLRSQAMFSSRSPAGRSVLRTAITSAKSRLYIFRSRCRSCARWHLGRSQG